MCVSSGLSPVRTLNPLRAPRGRPSGRAGATATTAGTSPRPRAHSPGARSSRCAHGPASPARVRLAPSAAVASRRCGTANTVVPARGPARARSSGAPVPARRLRRAGRGAAAASSPAPPRAAMGHHRSSRAVWASPPAVAPSSCPFPTRPCPPSDPRPPARRPRQAYRSNAARRGVLPDEPSLARVRDRAGHTRRRFFVAL